MRSLSRAAKNLLRKARSLVTEESYALDQLDRKLKRHLKFRGGFFIEAGANDGLKFSNTLYFEQYRNWTGLLVEPIPELAEQCRKNRPNCIVESCALVAADFEHDSIEMQFCNLMSLVKGAMKSAEEEQKHVALGCEIQDVETYTIRVPARTLTSLLDEHGITKIDLLSLDVEGYELSALKGIDFERHRPAYLLVEARYRREIDDHLQPWYDAVDELSHHDVLYRSRT